MSSRTRDSCATGKLQTSRTSVGESSTSGWRIRSSATGGADRRYARSCTPRQYAFRMALLKPAPLLKNACLPSGHSMLACRVETNPSSPPPAPPYMRIAPASYNLLPAGGNGGRRRRKNNQGSGLSAGSTIPISIRLQRLARIVRHARIEGENTALQTRPSLIPYGMERAYTVKV